MLGITDWPAAGDFGQGLNVFALIGGDLEFLGRRRVGFGVAQVEVAQRGVADVGKPRLHEALGRLRAGAWPMRLHARGGGATRQAQAMHLADHGIAGDAAETPRNLAGAEAVGPQLFQEFDAFIVPGHALVSPVCATAEPDATCADSGLLRTSLERRSGAQRRALERQQPDRPTINARLMVTLNLEVLTRTAQWPAHNGVRLRVPADRTWPSPVERERSLIGSPGRLLWG